jgi:hypothetical protein
MRIEFDYTFDDIKEAMTPEAHRNPRPPKYRGLFGWVLFIFLAVVLFLLLQLAPRSGPPSRTAPLPKQEIWITLSPSLLPASLFAVFLVFTLLGMRRRAAAGSVEPIPRGGGLHTALVVVLLIVVLACVIPLVQPSLGVTWRPTRRAALLVAFLPWIVLLVLVFPASFAFRAAKIRQTWRTSFAGREHRVWELSEEGVRITDALTDVHYRWPIFTRVREIVDHFLLFRVDGQFHVLPKRAFADTGQLQEARAIFNTHAARCDLLTPVSAFPVVPIDSLPPPSG